MKIKRIYFLGILSIILALSVIGWLTRQPRNMEPVKIYKSTTSELHAAEQPAESKEVPEEKRDINDVQWARDALIKSLEVREPEDTAYKIAYKKALESPAFAEYQKRQNANHPRFDLTLWWDFLESQGLGSGRMAQEANFRAFFPTGEYADYDLVMEKRLAEIFLEMGPPDSTAHDDIVRHTVAGLMEFRKDHANLIWMRGRFNGYNGDLDWADNIRQNAATIVAGATEQETPTSMFTESHPTTEFPIPTDFEEEIVNTPTPQSPNTETEVVPSFEVLEEIRQNIEVLETGTIEQLVPETLQLSGDFETALRERFSPQRLNSAMQTLGQYGPEEGLRRLKESYPEMAAHVERFIRTNKETD